MSIYEQFFCLFIFIITGIAIGILFDCFRIVRKSFKTPDLVTYIEDIIFWLIAGCILLFSIFYFNNGELRSYVFVGIAFGIILYLLTISKYFIKISVTILVFLKKIIYFPAKVFINLLKKTILKPISFIVINIRGYFTKYYKNKIKKEKNVNSSNFYNKINE